MRRTTNSRRGPQMCISTFTLTRSSTFSISRSKRFRCRFLLLLLVIPGLFSGWTDEGLFSGWISSLGNISAALWGAKTCKSAISGKGIEFQQQRHAPPQMFLKALMPWADAAWASIILPWASPMQYTPGTTFLALLHPPSSTYEPHPCSLLLLGFL